MRLDVDSRLTAPWPDAWSVMDERKAVYWANKVVVVVVVVVVVIVVVVVAHEA